MNAIYNTCTAKNFVTGGDVFFLLVEVLCLFFFRNPDSNDNEFTRNF